MRTFLDKLYDIKLKEITQRERIIPENDLRKQAESIVRKNNFRNVYY